jgi:preprotein translocase SecE subunit
MDEKRRSRSAPAEPGIVRLPREVIGELRKVVWPTFRQTLGYTGFVVVMVAVTALISSLLDSAFTGLWNQIIR